jgi:hypothetical protein
MIWIWLILGLILAAGLYVGWVYFTAWFEVRALPRSETFICNKHGPIQKESTISFSGVPYCSLCFHQNLSSAERILGNPR